MNRQIIIFSALCTAFVLGLQQTVLAHNEDLKSGNIKPTIGMMSEIVARQKLETYGVTNVSQLQLVGNRYIVKGIYDNKPVELEMNAQTGLLTEKVTNTRLLVAPSLRNRIINNYQIRLERPELVKPERIQLNNIPQ